MRFRLLEGLHEMNDPTTGQPVIYQKGAIIETDTDLVGRFNSPGMPSQKFERLHDDPVAAAAQAGFNTAFSDPLQHSLQRQQGESLEDYRKRLDAALKAEQDKESAAAGAIVAKPTNVDSLRSSKSTSPATTPTPAHVAVDHGATLDSMSFDELKKLAAEEEVDVASCKNKAEALKTLKAALNLRSR